MTLTASILLVVRDPSLRETLRAALAGQGRTSRLVDGAEAALAVQEVDPADLVVVQADLPGEGGLELCRRLRALPRSPLLLVIAPPGEAERVRALEAGADDCVSSPPGVRELRLRMAALLRRLQAPGGPRPLQLGRIRLDPERHLVDVDGVPIALTLTELRILQQLALADGAALSREALRARVWGEGATVDERAVDTHIRRLRAKLGAARIAVETVHRSGYRLRT